MARDCERLYGKIIIKEARSIANLKEERDGFYSHYGYTFKSQWQDMHGNGRKTKVVATLATTNMSIGKTCTIAVRLVYILGTTPLELQKLSCSHARDTTDCLLG
jgi:hypothetical protein